MTKVLLTGSSGFVGGHILQYLLDKTDWKVTTVPTKALMGGTLSNETYDYIIHLASASSVEESFKDPKNFIKRNITSTLNLLEYARVHPPKKLLHMSSVEVLTPSNPYAASKAAQEAIVKSYAMSFGIPTFILRSGNIIGEGQGPDKFIPKIQKQIANGEVVSIYTTEDGEIGKRRYINVQDVVKQIVEDIGVCSGTFTIEGKEEIDNLKMAEQVAQAMRQPLKYKLVTPSSTRPSYTEQFADEDRNLLDGNGTVEDALSWIK